MLIVSPRPANCASFSAFRVQTPFSNAHAAASRANLRRAASSRAASSIAAMVLDFLRGGSAEPLQGDFERIAASCLRGGGVFGVEAMPLLSLTVDYWFKTSVGRSDRVRPTDRGPTE